MSGFNIIPGNTRDAKVLSTAASTTAQLVPWVQSLHIRYQDEDDNDVHITVEKARVNTCDCGRCVKYDVNLERWAEDGSLTEGKVGEVNHLMNVLDAQTQLHH
jgi:hypothetical protein